MPSSVSFGQVRQVSSYYTLNFPRVVDVARFTRECAIHLGNRFGPPQLTGVSDQMDPAVPRAIFGSVHGFSTIVISAAAIGLNVVYSPDWQVDPDLRLPHLLDSVAMVNGLLTVIGNPRMLYSGSNFVYEMDTSALEADLKTYLKERLLATSVSEGVFDLNVRLTRVLDEKWFLNTTYENFRTWPQVGSVSPFSMPLSMRLAQVRGLRMTVELNDRYAFNEVRGYVPDPSTANLAINRAFTEASQALDWISK